MVAMAKPAHKSVKSAMDSRSMATLTSGQVGKGGTVKDRSRRLALGLAARERRGARYRRKNPRAGLVKPSLIAPKVGHR